MPRLRARVCHLRALVLLGRVRVLRTRSRGRPLRRLGVVAVIGVGEAVSVVCVYVCESVCVCVCVCV